MALDPETLKTMPLEAEGLAAALEGLGVGGRLEDEPAQEDLFGSSPLLRGDLQPVKGRGRPAGSTNKTTEAWRGFILSHYRSPLLFMADITMVPTLELAKYLQCEPLQALALQRGVAADLAPYLHRKQPIAIDAGEDKALPSIQQIIVGAEALGRLFPQVAGNAGDFEYAADAVEGEVAGEKSQSAGDGGVSD